MAETYSNSLLEYKSPQYAYALVILSGGVAFIATQQGDFVDAWLYYGLIAALFSSIWPYRSWQWSVWLCLPIVLLIFFDLIVRGSVQSLLINGVTLTKAFPSACFGAYLGSKLSVRKIANRFSGRQGNGNRLKSRGALSGKNGSAPLTRLKPSSPGRNYKAEANAIIAGHQDQLNDELIQATQDGDTERIRQLIAGGADVNRASRSGWTPLLIASLGGDPETLEHLFGSGASPDKQSDKGHTPLMIATIEGHGEVVRALIEHGADVSIRDDRGWTALRFAVSMDEPEILRALVEAGADVNSTDDEGRTALMQAAQENTEASLRVLLNSGADPHLKDHNAQTALTMARKQGHAKIVRLLKEAEAGASKATSQADHTSYLYLLKEELEEGLSFGPGVKQSDDLTTRVLKTLQTVQEHIDAARKEDSLSPSELSHKLMLTLKEAALLSGLPRQHLVEAVKAGRLRAQLLDHAWRIKRSDLDNYLRKLS